MSLKIIKHWVLIIVITNPLLVLAIDSSNGNNLHNINVYATLRPTLAVINEEASPGDDDTTVDIRDYNSFAGIKGSVDIGDSLTAIFQGEWVIDIPRDGEFGRGRRGYAGLQWDEHRVALGKQRPPHYLLIGGYVDVFNNENSPFSYIQVGPFFVDNMLTYRYQTGDLRILTAAQFNGREGDDKQDFFNTGASYQFDHVYVLDNLYIAGAFLKTTSPSSITANLEGDENTIVALALSTTLNNLYLATAYQDINTDINPAIDDRTVSGNTFEMAAIYSLGDGYRAKLGLFTFDDGRTQLETNEYKGFNLTLERQLHPSVWVHVDYVSRDFTARENYSAVAVGIRYDFDFTF